jgi:Protein of unknown function (DUF2380)
MKFLLSSGALSALGLFAVTAIAAPDGNALRTIVMPFKFVGNIDAKLDNEHTQRLEMANAALREGLAKNPQYDLVDKTASEEFSAKVIEALNNNACEHCEAEYAKKYDAKRIIVPWVFRLSQLVLTMHFDTIDAVSGKIIDKKALDFRGDNDDSWRHTIDYFLRHSAQ